MWGSDQAASLEEGGMNHLTYILKKQKIIMEMV
jgi:hypothetical protein